MSSNVNTVALHGWTAVPADAAAILGGKPYLHKPELLLVHSIPFPSEDPVVARVQAYAKEKLPPQTYNHSMRVYYWATAILTQQFPTHAEALSPSTLALTCLLHDIGTTHDNLRATQLSFEFYGGILALDLLLPKNTHTNHHHYHNDSDSDSVATKSQAEAVCEAIIRHQDLGTTGTVTFLTQLIQLATIYDNVGGNPEIVHADTRVDVNRAFPRKGWSGCFASTIREELHLKPWAHTTHLGDFEDGILRNDLMAEFDSWE